MIHEEAVAKYFRLTTLWMMNEEPNGVETYDRLNQASVHENYSI